MKIPYISERRKRKQEEALIRLNNLSEHYSIIKHYEGSATFFKLMKNAKKTWEKPTKTLKKFILKEGWFAENGINSFMNEISNLPENEKRQKLLERLWYSKKSYLSIKFDEWVLDAEPILQNIIEKNPEKMNGFTYYKCFMGGGYGTGAQYKRIFTKDDGFYLQSFDAYANYPELDKITSNEIAKQILEGILDPIIGFHLERRNKLVKEIKRRTGRDLKKEITIFRKN